MNTATQKRELDIKANEGMIFDNDDGTWSGGLKIEEEYFHVNMTSREEGDRAVIDLTGSSASDSIEAHPPLDHRGASNSDSGKARPEIVGMIRTQNGNVEKEFSGWKRVSGKSGKSFVSVRIDNPRQSRG